MLDDLRFILRNWRARPGFFAATVLTLTLGVALAGAVFAFADGYLFRPLPFPSADQLYRVSNPDARPSLLLASETVALRRSVVAGFGFVEWGPSDRLLGELIVGDRTLEANAYEVSEGFRSTIRLPLVAGRDFSAGDHREGQTIPVWLAHRFWVREFGGDRAVLNRTFRLEHLSGAVFDLQVVGILAPEVASFDLNNVPPDLVVAGLPPARLGPNSLSSPIVRLPDGMSREQGETRIAEVLQAIAPAADGRPRTVRLRSLREAQVAGGRPTALTFFTGAMLVVLLAAVNLVHLLLVRGVSRSPEMATRAALGASRWRIVRLFVLESLSLGVVGIWGGLLLAWWLAGVIEAQVPQFPTSGRNLALVPMLFAWRAVGFAAGVGLVVAIAAGGWPAWRALRQPLPWITRRTKGSVEAVPARTSRTILACELGLATVVLAGTVFIGIGIWQYLNQPLGFDYADRFAITFRSSEPRRLLPREVAEALRAVREIPGVMSAGLYNATNVRGVEVPGRAIDPGSVAAYGAGEGHFESWNLRIRTGRRFTEAEYEDGSAVAVVDQQFASLMWPGGNALGQSVRVGDGPSRHVVGVVETPRWSLARELKPAVYVPIDQPPASGWLVAWIPKGTVAAVGDRIAAAIREAAPVADVRTTAVTMDTLFLREIGEARFQTPFMIVLGLLALALAAVGVFGVVSYIVERRTREFGIRLALGARPRDVWRGVTRQGVVPAIVGLAMGVAGARALEQIVRASVFGWQSSGLWAVSIVAVLLFAVAVAAAVAPARRAMRIDPAATLRME
jgi:predicted permease